MTKLKFSFTALLLGCVCGVAAASADDSVYVNLSVLEELGSGSNPAMVSEPLFPIVKKAPVASKVKGKKAKPAPRAVAKIKKTASKPQPQPQSQPQPQPQPQPQLQAPTADAHRQIPYVEDAAPVEVVDVEPTKPIEPEVKADNRPAAPTVVPAETPAEMPKKDIAPEPTTEPTTEPIVSSESSALLVEEPAAPQPAQSSGHDIVFADGVDELTEAQKQQVDAIIASFADAANHKIAIYSYNLDDGVDAFKKKRQSLNRAVAVRSYLLPKGYKNFSIKVVNVDAASGKANTVELEELD